MPQRPVAQPPLAGIAVGVVIEQLLVIGRAAGAGPLGGVRILGLGRPIEPVVRIGSEVVLGIEQRRDGAVVIA